MKKFILPLCTVIGMAQGVHAQNTCATDQVYQQLKSLHPEIAMYEAQVQQELKDGLRKLDIQKLSKSTLDTTHYDVPIVIHVVHNYGAEYLSDDAIFNAVSYWADVYLKRNADTADVIPPFKPYVGDPRIRLRLATIDPNGNPTKGITHEHSYLTTNAGDQAKVGGWPQNKYINIWFINTFSGDHTGAAAYAYYPSSGAGFPYWDGVIGLYSYINTDKAIPHEIGHVLNLQHTWGDNNSPGNACGDDGVDDTPPTKGHLPGCSTADLYDASCSMGYVKNGIDYPDTANTQNIMDYAYCQKMFTIGQTNRMLAALTGSTAGRNNLWSTANLAATGALAARPDLKPIADFSVERPTSNALPSGTEPAYFMGQNSGLFFAFVNRSWNDTITSVSWTLSNGATTPTSTSIQNRVTSKFTQPGWATISLTATSNTGSSTVSKSVYVADTNAIQPAGYVQNFATAADMDKWPIFNYFDNNFKWEQYTGAGVYDNTSLRYRSYDYRSDKHTGTISGDHDDFFSPAFNLSAYQSGALNLNFYSAGSYLPANGAAPNDTVTIYGSVNGGKSWTVIQTLTGSDIFNAGAQSSEFVPGASQWKAQTINVPAALRGAITYFRFQYKAGTYNNPYVYTHNGNNFYMDRLTITPFTTEVSEVAANSNTVKLYPNPTHGGCNVAFTTGNDGKVTYSIHDLTGKLVYIAQESYAPNTVVEHSIPASAFPATGFYMVTLTISDKSVTQKLVVQ
ncbi:zinc-dependent metalloprotease [Chitinophagaceae bacterium MMS25-I14]